MEAGNEEKLDELRTQWSELCGKTYQYLDVIRRNFRNEKQNLVRVKDILSELEKQAAPLEKQSEVAKIYLRRKEELKNLEDDRRKYHLPGKVRAPGTASNEMCTFLIINISSLQLIPVNVIAYRSQYGSINPAAIVGPGILATAVSTLVAIIYCKCKEKPDAGQ